MASMNCRKLYLRLRLRLKKGEIAAHWQSVSGIHGLVIALSFGNHKVDPATSSFQFPNTIVGEMTHD